MSVYLLPVIIQLFLLKDMSVKIYWHVKVGTICFKAISLSLDALKSWDCFIAFLWQGMLKTRGHITFIWQQILLILIIQQYYFFFLYRRKWVVEENWSIAYSLLMAHRMMDLMANQWKESSCEKCKFIVYKCCVYNVLF